MSGLRVGIICDRVEPFYRGGYERRYYDIAKNISANNEVHIFTSCPSTVQSNGERLQFHNIAPMFDFFSTNSRSLSFDAIWTAGVARILKFDLDVIDCNFTPLIHLFLTKILSIIKGTALAFTIHEAYTLQWLRQYFTTNIRKYRLPGAFAAVSYIGTRLAVNVPDKIISVSKVTRKALIDGFGVDSMVVPNGIDISLFNSKKNSSRDSIFRLVYTGRLVKEKGLDVAIKALSRLTKEGSNIELRIIGEGPDKQRLLMLTNQFDLNDRIRFLGNVSDEAKIHELCSSDAFIMPSFREGFSIATLEAMAAGLPVIAAIPSQPSFRGILELVTDGVNGVTYDCESFEQLAIRIESLFKDHNMYEKLATGSISTAHRYDWSKITPIYEDTLQQMVEAKTNGG